MTDCPLHIAGLLYFVPDDIFDAAGSSQGRAAPALGSPLQRGGWAASGGAGRAMEVKRRVVRPVSRPASPQVVRRPMTSRSPGPELRRSPSPLDPRGTAPASPSFYPPSPRIQDDMAPLSGAPSRKRVPRSASGRISRVPHWPLWEVVRELVDLSELQVMFPHLRPVWMRFGEQERAALTLFFECLAACVRAMDPYSAKAVRRGSRSGTHVDLRRVRDQLGEAHKENQGLRRELSAMNSRIAQLSTQLVESSGALSRPRKRYREDEEDEPPGGVCYCRHWTAREDWDSCHDPYLRHGTTLKVTVVAGSRLS